jgi:hypothetical protein
MMGEIVKAAPAADFTWARTGKGPKASVRLKCRTSGAFARARETFAGPDLRDGDDGLEIVLTARDAAHAVKTLREADYVVRGEDEAGPLYPDVRVKLTGEDGNAFFILGRCQTAARKAGLSKEEMDRFDQEARSGDYDTLLQTCMKWFDVD